MLSKKENRVKSSVYWMYLMIAGVKCVDELNKNCILSKSTC